MGVDGWMSKGMNGVGVWVVWMMNGWMNDLVDVLM